MKRFATAAAVGLAALVSGCSGAGSPLSPAAVPAGSLDVRGGNTPGNARNYTAAFAGAPVSLAVNVPQSISLTVTNHPSTQAHQDLGYVTIAVPAGLSVSGASVTADAGKSWSTHIASGVIQVFPNAPEGQNRLAPGQSLQVTFSATGSACGSFTWMTAAFKAAPADTPFALTGSQPSLQVVGCQPVAGCARGQGYWKNHPGAWPVTSLTLGTVSYSQTGLLSIFGGSVAGNGLVQLAHQLIAAKLNVAAGVDGSSVASAIAQADALIGSLVVPPVGSGHLATSLTSALNDALTAFNESGACE